MTAPTTVSTYGKEFVEVGYFNISLPEVMYYLYLLVFIASVPAPEGRKLDLVLATLHHRGISKSSDK